MLKMFKIFFLSITIFFISQPPFAQTDIQERTDSLRQAVKKSNNDVDKKREEVDKAFEELQKYMDEPLVMYTDTEEELLDRANRYFDNKEFKNALDIYRELAKSGNTIALNKIGNMYHDGLGVKKDLKESFKYYERAANNGNKYAQFNLGNSYYHGDGCDKNIPKALEWLKVSCDSGYKQACQSHSYIVTLSNKNNKSKADTPSSTPSPTNSNLYVNCSYKVDRTLGTIADAASTIISLFGGESLKSIVAETAGEFFSGTEDHRFQCDFHPNVFKYSVSYFYTGEKKKFREKETKTFKPNHSKNDVRFATATTSSNLDYITIRADTYENNEEVKNLYVYEIDSENNKMIPIDMNDFLTNIVDLYEIQ